MDESQALREFIREITVRVERSLLANAREWREDNRLVREEMRAHFAKQDEKLDEVIAEGKASREALFRILDKLDGKGGAAPA